MTTRDRRADAADRRPLVVIAKKTGRLANRLVLFAHFIGAAEQHGFDIANRSFVPYHRHFPCIARDVLTRYPANRSVPGGRWMREAVYRATTGYVAGLHAVGQHRPEAVNVLRIAPSEKVDLNGERFLGALDDHRKLFVQGWRFRSTDNVRAHRDAILRYLEPDARFTTLATALTDRARADGSLLIGVHRRLGDYRSYHDGRFLYTDDTYRQTMERVAALHDGRHVRFLVSSDEPVALERFSGLDVVAAHGHQLVDLYALARCDAIVGPPSTYSRWASFVGAVPLCVVRDPGREIVQTDFFARPGLEERPAGEPQ